MINFEKEFLATRGQPFEKNGVRYYLMYTIPLENCPTLLIEFQSAKPPYRQGIHLESDQPLRIAGKESQAMLLWYDTAPRRVEVDCKGCTSVRIWNVWDTGDGTVHSWHHGAAMIVEPAGHRSWLFRCNDGRPDDACDDLVFRVHLLPSLPTE
jgi:hypothetical protein